MQRTFEKTKPAASSYRTVNFRNVVLHNKYRGRENVYTVDTPAYVY